ncbi:MAG: nucleotide disphospho-sugar-binding domain-containing protein [Pseudomonadota bacterium]
MRVVFASHGSLGDLVPFLEIGKVLAADGAAVVVATHEAHRAAVEGSGLTFAPMRPDRPHDPAFHERFMDRRRGAKFVYTDFLSPAIADSDKDLMAATEGADILVSVTLALAAPLVAARRKLPWLSAAFQPAMLYSARDPSKIPGLPLHPRLPGFNRWLLEKARVATADWVAPLIAHRRAEGLGDYPDHPAFLGQHSAGGVLALYSPLFAPVPADAPPRTVQTGQVLQTGGPACPPDVARFLDAGPPPIVFTLGSASAHAARRFFIHSVRHARSLGARALCLVGRRENLSGLMRSADVFAATSAPYHAVFPRAQAVVHQGGIGTIALGVSAGVPMLLTPFAHDQIDNAARAARAGLAHTMPLSRYPAAGGRAIARLLADRALTAALPSAQSKINAENGAQHAAAKIRDCVQGASHWDEFSASEHSSFT